MGDAPLVLLLWPSAHRCSVVETENWSGSDDENVNCGENASDGGNVSDGENVDVNDGTNANANDDENVDVNVGEKVNGIGGGSGNDDQSGHNDWGVSVRVNDIHEIGLG